MTLHLALSSWLSWQMAHQLQPQWTQQSLQKRDTQRDQPGSDVTRLTQNHLVYLSTAYLHGSSWRSAAAGGQRESDYYNQKQLTGNSGCPFSCDPGGHSKARYSLYFVRMAFLVSLAKMQLSTGQMKYSRQAPQKPWPWTRA